MTDGESTGAADGPDSSRERILDAALRGFSRRGFGETSVAAVARSADVSKGLVYHYFDTKRDVLAAVLRRGGERVERTLGTEAGEPPDLPAAVVMDLLGLVAEDLPWWRLYFRLRMQPETAGDLDLASWGAAVEGALERSLARAGSSTPGRDARALAAAVEGTAQRYVLDPDGYPLVDVAEAIVAPYLGPA